MFLIITQLKVVVGHEHCVGWGRKACDVYSVWGGGEAILAGVMSRILESMYNIGG